MKPTCIPAGAVVVLDVDDTLYLERCYVRSGFEAVGRYLHDQLGVAGVATTLWSGFESGVRGDAFDRALDAHGVAPEGGLVDRMVEHYRTHEPTIELAADARRFLGQLDGHRTGIITDGPAVSQRAKLRALDLPLADPITVVTGERGEGWTKPNPPAFRLIEEEHGAEPSSCWYLGDNPHKDFVTPLARGWRSVRIRRPRSLHYAAATPPSVVEVETLDGLEVEPVG